MKYRYYFNPIFYYFLLFVPHSTIGEHETDWGPYSTMVIKSEKCAKPARPYEKVPGIFFHCDLYNTSKAYNLLAGNLTVVRVDQNPKIMAKGYVYENGKWNIIHVVNSRGCQGILYKFFKLALNVMGNSECVKKGTYLFKNIDFNALQHKWRQESQYGVTLWRLEIISKLGTSICWEYEVLTELPSK